MSKTSNMTERLIVHARLCRELASACWNEEMAHNLEQLADDCMRAARDTEEPSVEPGGKQADMTTA
jgi:hypothetical protein